MPMTLNDVPLALITQNLANTQNSIRQNFISINDSFEWDHQGYNLTDTGRHKKVTFLQQAADATTGSTQLALYNKLATNNNLFLRFANNGDVINITFQGSTQGPLGGNGSTVFPSGIIHKWATLSTDGTSSRVINVNDGAIWPGSPTIPANRTFSAQLTSVANSHVTYLAGINSAAQTVTVTTSSASRQFTILIIASLRS